MFLLLCITIWWIPRRSEEAPPATIQVVTLAGASVGYQRTASFSPDGSQLAFDQTGENSGIYTTLADGEKSLRLTSNPGDCCPAWSPDGRQIAFSRYSGEGIAIYVISALGGTEHRLYQEPGAFTFHRPGFLSWSPDTKFLAFCDRKENEAHASIALLSLADFTTRRLTTPPAQSYDYAPAFSPDGSQVAFIRSSGSGVASDIFVVRASSDVEPRRLTFDNTVTEGTLAWTADGRDVVFTSVRGGLPTLWRISAAEKSLRPIAGIGAIACCPSISRQGNQIVYQNSVANYGIWRVDLQGRTHVHGQPNLLTYAKGLNLRPDFSSDGSRIAFESDRSGYPEIWTCDSNGSNCGQLTSLRKVAERRVGPPTATTLPLSLMPENTVRFMWSTSRVAALASYPLFPARTTLRPIGRVMDSGSISLPITKADALTYGRCRFRVDHPSA